MKRICSILEHMVDGELKRDKTLMKTIPRRSSKWSKQSSRVQDYYLVFKKHFIHNSSVLVGKPARSCKDLINQ
jgi:hypothetical protein